MQGLSSSEKVTGAQMLTEGKKGESELNLHLLPFSLLSCYTHTAAVGPLGIAHDGKHQPSLLVSPVLLCGTIPTSVIIHVLDCCCSDHTEDSKSRRRLASLWASRWILLSVAISACSSSVLVSWAETLLKTTRDFSVTWCVGQTRGHDFRRAFWSQNSIFVSLTKKESNGTGFSSSFAATSGSQDMGRKRIKEDVLHVDILQGLPANYKAVISSRVSGDPFLRLPSPLHREGLCLRRNSVADCLQLLEMVCVGSKTFRQQNFWHIWTDAHIWWWEMIKGVGVEGVGLVYDLLPSLLERSGEDELASRCWKEGHEQNLQCPGNPTSLTFLMQSPKP